MAAAADERDALDFYERIARILYHVPEEDKVPDLLLFHAPRLVVATWNIINRGPVEINGRSIDFRIIFRGSGKSKADDKTGWTGITFEVAAAGLFGDVEKVKATDFWSVLIYLYKCKFEYIEEMKNQPNK